MQNLILIAISSIVLSYSTIAQKLHYEFILSGGFGFSVLTRSDRLNINSSLRENGFNPLNSIQIPYGYGVTEIPYPLLNVQLDHTIIERFSLGIAYAHVKFSTNQTGLINDTLYHAKVSLSKQNIGIRLLYHFNPNETFDVYTGGRIGYSVRRGNYEITNDFGDDKAVPLFAKNKGTLQFIFGIRNYFNNFFGLNFEICLGAPYFLNGGVCFKIR
ncbi:MAG: hypothetical protein RIT43_1674 [Bacteroidota bacterium]|jgi:hypothetical protein